MTSPPPGATIELTPDLEEYLVPFRASVTDSALAEPRRRRNAPRPDDALGAHVRFAVRNALPTTVYRFACSRVYYPARMVARHNPGRGRMLPDFLVIGAAKAGTTSLFGWLGNHPLVNASTKEIHFFNENYFRGEDWYRSHFPLERDRAVFEREHGRSFLTGEGTASYFHHYWAPVRVAKWLPHAKLIITLRNPVDRAYSQFQECRRSGDEPLESLEAAVAAEPERLRAELARMHSDSRYGSWPLRNWSYVLRSRYAEQVERWLHVFPRDQLLFLKSEEMWSDPQRALDAVHEFLGLPPHRYVELPHLRSGGRYESVSSETRSRLSEYFRPHNERLQELTGTQFSWDG